MRSLPILISICLLLGTLSCNTPKKGALSPESRTELDMLADANVDVREKMFAMAVIMAGLMNEVAATENDVLAIEKIQKFRADNESALVRLNSQFDRWQKNELDENIISFVVYFNEQASARSLRKLTPALKTRFAYNKGYVTEVEELTKLMSIRR